METIFVFTHTIMSICLIGVIYMSIRSESRNNQETDRSMFSGLVLKVKSIHINTGSVYRTAAGLLAVFIK